MRTDRMQLDNKKLLEIICEVYDYKVKLNDDGSVELIGDEIEKYNSIELALVDWLDTLIESEEQYIVDEVDITWVPEINQIKEIKSELLYDNKSTSIEDNLIYGEVPKSLYKNLSAQLDEQIKKVNSFLELSKKYNLNKKVIKASLTAEFILEDGELKYLKLANLNSIKKLINGDTSELDFTDLDLYNHEGKLEERYFIPIDNLTKFVIDIPVVLTVSEDYYLTLETPVNPLYLI